MKKETVKAYSNQGGQKVYVGEKEVDIPTKVNELVKHAGGSEELAVARYVKSYRIEVQASIRNKRELSETEKVFKALTPAQQAALIAKLETLENDNS